MDGDGPQLDKAKGAQVQPGIHGAEVGKDVDGQGLKVAIEGMEGKGGVGRAYLPLVVGLVKPGVEEGLVLKAVAVCG
jgi:hypothetical protein